MQTIFRVWLWVILFSLAAPLNSWAVRGLVDVDTVGNLSPLSVSVRVTNGGVQSLSSAGTVATWNTVDHETGGELWDVGAPTRLVAPITGTYVVVVNIAAESDSIGQIVILKNGVLAHNGTVPRFWTGGGSTTAIVQLTAGQYVECQVWPATTVNSIVTAGRHYFAMALLK